MPAPKQNTSLFGETLLICSLCGSMIENAPQEVQHEEKPDTEMTLADLMEQVIPVKKFLTIPTPSGNVTLCERCRTGKKTKKKG